MFRGKTLFFVRNCVDPWPVCKVQHMLTQHELLPGNQVDLLIITEDPQNWQKNAKQCIFLTARVHPGETQVLFSGEFWRQETDSRRRQAGLCKVASNFLLQIRPKPNG
eukprot:306915-Hanusia_phi.AAC.9